MSALQKIPVLRAFHRYWRELTRPAPLQEFSDYDAYWKARIRDGRRADVLDRHRIIARLIPDGASVLDIGCGDGAFLRYVRDVHPSCRLMGLDISETAVGALRKEGIAAQRIDPDLPFDNQIHEHWENIVLMEVIEHVADAEGLMRQVLALQPKRVFVTIPNVGFLVHRLRLMFAGRFPITTIIYHMKEHVRFWTAKDFIQWSETFGLRVRSFHGQVDRPDKIVIWLARTFPSLFASQVVYELEPRPKPF
jgi:methionine biosynthesis protein MetW